MTELGVIHGRFQPLHNDHMKYILAGKARCRHLVVGITNPDPILTRADPADTERSDPSANPLTYFERYTIVVHSLLEAGVRYEEFSVTPFPINLPELYHFYVPTDAVFYMTIYDDWGRKKLAMFRSLGLRVEVLWDKPREQKGLTGKEVRRRMAEDLPWEQLVPPAAERIMARLGVQGRVRGSLSLRTKPVEGD
jgi:nicotinamide mononucleotide adenylyltransferase